MGYRHYFLKIKNSMVDKIKDLSYKKLMDNFGRREDREYGYFSIHNKNLKMEEVFEFGKLYWCDTAQRIYALGKPLFTNKETQEEFYDYNPYVVGKEAVIEAINIYIGKIRKNIDMDTLSYNELLEKGYDKKDLANYGRKENETVDEQRNRLLESIAEEAIWINSDYFIDLEKPHSLTGSWAYKHTVFNLIHLLKTINWEKESLIFLGW